MIIIIIIIVLLLLIIITLLLFSFRRTSLTFMSKSSWLSSFQIVCLECTHNQLSVMLVIKDFVILVIILTKTGCCQEIVPTRLVSTEKRPLDDDLVFIINTNTKAQCHYICIQNNECVAVIYRDTGYLCHGYKTMYEEEYLVEDEYGWHVERTGILYIYV